MCKAIQHFFDFTASQSGAQLQNMFTHNNVATCKYNIAIMWSPVSLFTFLLIVQS